MLLMLDRHLRLELLKLMIPQASRVGISEPTHIIKSCLQFEEYVLGSDTKDELPDSSPKRKGGRPKRTTDEALSLESDPAHSG